LTRTNTHRSQQQIGESRAHTIVERLKPFGGVGHIAARQRHLTALVAVLDDAA
jgi:hypothetical protein